MTQPLIELWCTEDSNTIPFLFSNGSQVKTHSHRYHIPLENFATAGIDVDFVAEDFDFQYTDTERARHGDWP